MEEPNATTEASPLKDVPADVKSCVHDCSCGSNRETSLSMPVCFLVKEQAKSQVAIQDLHRRLNHVEIVQDDVIDAIIEFRNYLSDTKSFSNANHLTTSSLNVTRSPSNVFSPLTPGSKFSECNVPSALEPTVEVPHSILKSRTYCSKDCDHMYDELVRLPMLSTSHEQSQKHFDLIKTKDSVLESDKQDSGLDSDCREHNDIHPSLNKNVSNLLDPESNDELLQLLDEISHRSAILQKQLAVAEEVSPLDESKAMSSACQSETEKNGSKDHNLVESKFAASDSRLAQNKNPFTLNSTSVENRGLCAEQKVPSTVVESSSGKVGLLEMKPVSRVSARKRITNSIDSSTVSAILKETNAVDLQRQALIYLVDNAVLHTKLKEVEQRFSSQHIENEKLENSLKEEVRLLMMENRELRISLDEQKMESTGMKSRLLMLERVLQSVTHENQELNWQLGESLNLQNLSKRGLHNYSASFGCENPTSSFKLPRRSSMPSRFHQSDASCIKSKLLSNASSYLDITMEEAEDSQQPPPVRSTNSAFKCRNGPIYSSTPMLPLQKQKPYKAGINNIPHSSDTSPANFHSVKKCFKPNHSQEASSRVQKSDRYPEESFYRNGQDTCVKAMNFPHSMSDGTLPVENVSKFPFNTILEKLKSNSEYRLSKSASAKSSATSDSQTSISSNKIKAAALLENESHAKDGNSLQGSNSDIQRKKGRNIQQRIQNILDRIVAESEEAS